VSGKEGPATAEFFPCRNNRPRKQNPPKKKKKKKPKKKKKKKKPKQTNKIEFFFLKRQQEMARWGSTRARIFFGDKNYKQNKFESAEGGKKKRKCAKKTTNFWTGRIFPPIRLDWVLFTLAYNRVPRTYLFVAN